VSINGLSPPNLGATQSEWQSRARLKMIAAPRGGQLRRQSGNRRSSDTILRNGHAGQDETGTAREPRLKRLELVARSPPPAARGVRGAQGSRNRPGG